MSRPALLLTATLTLGACALAPVNTQSLQGARDAYRLAAADPKVQVRALVELSVAERALAEAEHAARASTDSGLVDHRAYLAQQRARIAQQTAAYRDAEARVATASQARNRVLLDARERDLDIARQQAAAAERRAQALGEEKAAQPPEPRADLGAELKRLQRELTELKAKQTERGWVLTLNNDLLFDPGKATLRPGGQRALDKLAQFMRREPERDIAIEGFTDSTGADEANRILSHRRADAVKQALVARGIEPAHIDARGYGPAFPVASNETPTGRQLNRRVEIIIDPS